MSLTQKLKTLSTLTTGYLVLAATHVNAASEISKGANAAKGGLGGVSVRGLFTSISNTLIYLVGAISVIVLIIAGLRYVTSAGNAAQVQGAKNTILYAVVGIVVAISAYAIVNFVIDAIG